MEQKKRKRIILEDLPKAEIQYTPEEELKLLCSEMLKETEELFNTKNLSGKSGNENHLHGLELLDSPLARSSYYEIPEDTSKLPPTDFDS